MVIPTAYAQLNFKYTGPGVPSGAEWTVGAFIDAFTGSALDLATLAGDAYTDQAFQASVATGVNLTSVLAKFGPNQTGQSAEVTVSEAGAGGTGAAPNLAYLVSKVTAEGGRRGRGRLYLPGVTEAGIDNAGAVLGATQTALQTQFDAFASRAFVEDWPLVLLHSDATPPTALFGLVVQPLAATQRRRMRR